MEKKLTRSDVAKIADKVMDLIKSEVGDDPYLIKVVLYQIEAQNQIEERLKNAL